MIGLCVRYSTWEPEENILDPRLIQQFVVKEQNKIVEKPEPPPEGKKRGRKPKTEEQKAAEAQAEAQKEVKVAENKGHSGLLGYFQSLADSKKKGNMEFSLGNLFSCLCCTSEDQTDSKKELMMMADKLDKIEKALNIKSISREPTLTPDPELGPGQTPVILPETKGKTIEVINDHLVAFWHKGKTWR